MVSEFDKLKDILNQWDIFINECSEDFIHKSMMDVIGSVDSIESMVDFSNVIYNNIFLSALLQIDVYYHGISKTDYWYYKNMYHGKITKSLHMRMNTMDLKLLNSIFSEIIM